MDQVPAQFFNTENRDALGRVLLRVNEAIRRRPRLPGCTSPDHTETIVSTTRMDLDGFGCIFPNGWTTVTYLHQGSTPGLHGLDLYMPDGFSLEQLMPEINLLVADIVLLLRMEALKLTAELKAESPPDQSKMTKDELVRRFVMPTEDILNALRILEDQAAYFGP